MKTNTGRQLRLGVILSYLSIGINMLSGLIFTPWMVSQIGDAQYGLYTLSNSLIALFVMDFGLSAATSRYVAKYNAENNQDKVNNFLGSVYKLYILIDIILATVFIIVYFFVDSIYVSLTPAELEQFKIVFVISAGFAVIHFPFVTLNGVLNAYERFIQLRLADIFHKIFYVVGNVIALSLGLGLYALVSINALSGIMTILIKLFAIKLSTPVKVNMRNRENGIYKEIFSFSIWVTLSSLASRLIFNIVPSILAITTTTFAIAVFGIVATIEGYAYTFSSAINGMFMPKIARIDNKNDNEQLQDLFSNVGRFQFGLNGLIVVGFAVVGLDFIRLWMNDSYADAYLGIMLTIIPSMFYNCLQIGNTTMTVRKKVNIQAIVNISMGVINVILCVILSSVWGVIGACVAICISYSLRVIALNVIFHKVLKLNVFDFAKRCYIRSGIVIAISILAGVGLNYLLSQTSWLWFLLKACIVGIIYLILTYVIALKHDEKAMLGKKIREILCKFTRKIKKNDTT